MTRPPTDRGAKEPAVESASPPPSHTHLRDLGLRGLREFVLQRGLPEYRYRQIASWIYGKLVSDFDSMTDLPLDFRHDLSVDAVVQSVRVAARQLSAVDGTAKYLFELSDGALVESVLMPHEGRTTLCVSSQVGCPLDCVFCQTGKGVFGRNLTTGEILDQICYLKRESGHSKVNLVFMGMGEPLLNFDALVRTIRVLNDPEGLDMGSRRITVSTAGLPRRMRDLGDRGVRCSLALSLNATTDAQRQSLMPAVGRYRIDELVDAAVYFHEKTGRRITLEYVLLKNANMSDEDAKRLGRISRRGPFKVNLIPYNAGREADFAPVQEPDIQRFIQVLLPYAPTVTVRRSKGPDIDAACGQLWTQTLARKGA
jgi:23S rRNA (adenine2503-C2)-methyltransferase